jgi:hypothetical protein
MEQRQIGIVSFSIKQTALAVGGGADFLILAFGSPV